MHNTTTEIPEIFCAVCSKTTQGDIHDHNSSRSPYSPSLLMTDAVAPAIAEHTLSERISRASRETTHAGKFY